ncbi:MAG TPA: hypothetical protein VH637_01630 [Streptosporangiaceae bacterium]|jgi:hypothetical protein
MSLPTRQQQALNQIERAIQARDPRLSALFATFGRLNAREAMPVFEQLTSRVSKLIRPLVLTPIVLALVVTTIVLGALAPGPQCSTQQAARGIALGQPSKQVQQHPQGRGGCPPAPAHPADQR